ncbi:MAG: ABC transporter ATP-binding protein [Verrucomicrobiota bacterium]
MIEVIDLSMSYGELVALDQLNLKIKKGEFFAFLGPNAAGKTTTIKLLTGLLQATSGTAKICGFDVFEEPLEVKKRIGYVPDVAEFYDKLTPSEFMNFIGDLFQMDSGESRRITADLFDRLSLGEHAGQRIEHLSHGTRQRLGIASALLHSPEVIVIDEPMVGLDPRHTRIIKEELKERSRKGVTVFMSTHQLNVAEELADRIGVINNGRLCAVGSLAELRQLPQSQSGAEGVESGIEDLFLALTEKNVLEVKSAE